MKFFEWNASFATGNEEIDYQHQNLFNMANNLYEMLDSGIEMRLGVEIFLEQLIEYTDYHFSTEERFMEQTNYQEFTQHKAMHDSLRKQVIDFQKKFKDGEADLSQELITFLKSWLLSHIQQTDTKLAKHLSQQTEVK